MQITEAFKGKTLVITGGTEMRQCHLARCLIKCSGQRDFVLSNGICGETIVCRTCK